MFPANHSSGTALVYGRNPDIAPDWLVWTYLETAVRNRPRDIAVRLGEEKLSFADLATQARSLAAGLRHMNVGPGDVVSYQLPNWAETLIVMLAALHVGAIANPIVTIYRHREISFILKQARSKVLFVPAKYRGFDYGMMADDLAAESGTSVVFCRSENGATRYENMATAAVDASGSPASNPDDDAFLIYTSGTEGNPKGVRHSQRTLVADALSIVAATAIKQSDVFYLATPLTHITGLLYGQLVPLVAGIGICLADQWDAKEAAATIHRYGCTLMCGATPFLHGLVDNPEISHAQLKTLRAFRCGGADVPPGLIRRARERGISALRTYGCTEHPTLTGDVQDDPVKAAETDGRVHPHNQVRIVPDEAFDDDVGEIQTRGPELFLGYRDASLDRDAFTTDGWYRTGDLGRLSDDGFITVVGRKKDIIIRKGENISAKEVEDILLEHKAVREAAVIGLPDRERGEIVTAVCVIAPGVHWSFKSMSDHMSASGIARQKIPERLEIIDVMPTTAAGKIRKVELRARFRRPTAG